MNCCVPDEHCRGLNQPKEKDAIWKFSEECELYAPETKHSGGLPFWPIEPAIVVHVDCGQSGECVEIKPYDERHM